MPGTSEPRTLGRLPGAWLNGLAFAALPLLAGGLLWQSRPAPWSVSAAGAAPPCEARPFTPSTAGPQVGGAGEYVFANNGALGAAVCQPARLVFRASGSRAAGEGSHLVVWGGNEQRATVYVDRFLDGTQDFSLPVDAGELWIEFRNDYYNPASKEDRNIILTGLKLLPRP